MKKCFLLPKKVNVLLLKLTFRKLKRKLKGFRALEARFSAKASKKLKRTILRATSHKRQMGSIERLYPFGGWNG